MAAPQLLLALDQGTTSSRAIVFDMQGHALAQAQRELPQSFPRPGWVEHDPLLIWSTQLDAAREVLDKADVSDAPMAAMGITNQRETTILWDRRSGVPVHPAIVWQDRRTADRCHALRASHGALIQERTGLVPDAYFSASKLEWLLENVPGARQRAQRGELAFGTVDAWLLWKLTGGPDGGVHATDISNASRTMLFDIHACQWDPQLLALFGIPREVLPEVRDSAGRFGEARASVLAAIPITGIAGDQQAALFGQNCLAPGSTKNTYGTGCFMLMNVGKTPAVSRNGLLSTVAWRLAAQRTPRKMHGAEHELAYALEGSVFVGGAVVQWLRDGLGLIHSAAQIEALARSVPDSGGVYLVPAFAGLGAPHWDQYARGTIAGITRGTTAGHLARAALESIAFQVADLLDVMRADAGSTGEAGVAIPQLRVDGGAASNDLLLQFQADLLQIPIVRPTVTETTALGAALLAGVGAGVLSTGALRQCWKAQAEFLPRMSADEVAQRRRRWSAALERSKDWEERAP